MGTVRSIESTTIRRPVLAFLAVLVVASTASASVAVAEPRIFVAGATVQSEDVRVGEPVDVSVRLKNTGDDGAKTIELGTNGSGAKSERFQVEGGTERRVTMNFSFDEPGTYEITVDEKDAGVVTVRHVTARTTSNWTEGRTVRVSGADLTPGETESVAFESSNRAFDVNGLDIVTTADTFEQDVTVHANVSNASVDVPRGETARVVGVLVVTDDPSVDRATVRFAVGQDRLAAMDVAADEVRLYHESDDDWKPLATERIATDADRVVYEATATEFSTFVAGSIEPAFTVEQTALDTVDRDDGLRVTVTADVENAGARSGEYTGALVMNDETVGEKTVTIPAGEERSIRLNHSITSAGTYTVAFDDQSVGVVSVVADDVDGHGDATTANGNGNENGNGDDATAADERPPDDDEPGPVDEIAALDVRLLAGGVGIGLAVLLVLLVLLRR